MHTFTLISFLSLTIFTVQASISCRNAQGSTVDWWSAIKYPESVSSGNSRYGYTDSTSGAQYTVTEGYVDQSGGPIDNSFSTINAMGVDAIDLAVFNDEPAGEESSEPLSSTYYGHAKGVIAYDESSQTGLYLMHSAPKFPNVDASGISSELPANSYQYGQSFLCISFQGQSNFNNIISNVEIIYADVYYSSGSLSSVNWKNDGSSAFTTVSTINGIEFSLVSKNPKYEEFLYDNILSSQLGESLYVESWGRPYMSPSCDTSS